MLVGTKEQIIVKFPVSNFDLVYCRSKLMLINLKITFFFVDRTFKFLI